jgi:2-hydroxychromene-2-carboxylate isomerase
MKKIEYFYSAHSAFAYLGSAALMRLCADHACQLIHRPIALSPVVEAVGGRSFAGRTQAHVDYFFGREIERWAEWREVPIIRFRPTHHDAPYELASRMILATGATGPQADLLSHAILQAHWRDDADLSDPEVLADVASSVGLDADRLIADARSDSMGDTFHANTTEAIDRNVLGSPTYMLDGDSFYGQDRLEMLARALDRPFAPTTWRNPATG